MDDRDTVLPIVPLVVRAAPAVPVLSNRSWPQRLTDALVGYLPVFLMSLLALATWWLVKNTPVSPPERASPPPRHEPDYEMHKFSVQRFAAEGAARSIIEGEVLKHFPDTDTLEIEGAHVLWTDEQGHQTQATAQHALANADGSEVQLTGEAHVVRHLASPSGSGNDDASRIEFRSEFLQVNTRAQWVRTDRAVTLVQAGSQLQAGSLKYDHRTGVLELSGRVRGTLAAVAESSIDGP